MESQLLIPSKHQITGLDGAFEIDKKIGKGDYGTVFSASRKADGKRVAIKIFKFV